VIDLVGGAVCFSCYALACLLAMVWKFWGICVDVSDATWRISFLMLLVNFSLVWVID
jgi:hypothetical protein